ncbi:hypothetical protein SAMN05216464_103214 [Mucilaginibacter pineti]|uniref:Uncharacterized protein n=2 Tax=Mucilaginibacter pineti TaxID=1391627 RepID=A0A1G6Z4X7_9SPHI|nr:hypothetical protein SAMN05216464_103214 [Mucilaginibacter pineti]
MKEKVDHQDASGQDYAYLIDRIALHKGRQQVYGTQINMGPSGTRIKPTIDTANIDKRRRSVGLEPIRIYLKKSDEIFKALNNGTFDQLQAKEDSLKRKIKLAIDGFSATSLLNATKTKVFATYAQVNPDVIPFFCYITNT